MARVLILSLVFPPDGVSTAQIIGDLAADLKGLGHDIVVLTTTPHYNRDPVAEAAQPLAPRWGRLLQASSFRGIPVYHVRVPRKGRRVTGRLAAWLLFHVMSTIASLRVVKHPEVILVPSPPLTMGVNAWAIARLKRCPFIYNVQELYPDLAITLGAITSALAKPRCAINAATSSPSASRDSGRSMSAVRPWPCNSTAITRRFFARSSRFAPNVSTEPNAPCNRISGSPLPWTS